MIPVANKEVNQVLESDGVNLFVGARQKDYGSAGNPVIFYS